MKIMLKRVRLSYPNLWKSRAVNEGDTPKFGCSLLLDKKEDKATIDELRTAIRKVAGEQWGAKLPKGVKFCVRDGSEKPDVPGYGKDVIFISASNEHRVPVVDRNKTPLAVEDGRPYAGCYVNASVRLWAQDNKFGKRINAQLLGIQFADDGEAFGEKPFDPESEFEDLSEGEQGEQNGGGEPSDEDKPADKPNKGKKEKASDEGDEDFPF